MTRAVVLFVALSTVSCSSPRDELPDALEPRSTLELSLVGGAWAVGDATEFSLHPPGVHPAARCRGSSSVPWRCELHDWFDQPGIYRLSIEPSRTEPTRHLDFDLHGDELAVKVELRRDDAVATVDRVAPVGLRVRRLPPQRLAIDNDTDLILRGVQQDGTWLGYAERLSDGEWTVWTGNEERWRCGFGLGPALLAPQTSGAASVDARLIPGTYRAVFVFDHMTKPAALPTRDLVVRVRYVVKRELTVEEA